ncbi:MAG: PilN domain-containing protein [Chloroflexi bacterium]|nr:PilN domain-containing protein [Chloroflexota bacterium]
MRANSAKSSHTPRHAFNLRTLREAVQHIPRRTLVLWLLATTLGLFMLPLTLVAASLTAQVSTLNDDVQAVIAAETTLPTLLPRVQSLNKQLAQVQAQAKQLQAVKPTLAAGALDWTTIMSAIGNYDPNQIAVDGLSTSDEMLIVTGRAANDAAILAYVNSLQQSNTFKNVVLQSVQIADSQAVTMTVVPGQVFPTATLTPTATITPTPNLRDAYEPDEITPPYYYLGQTQIHTFHPDNDIDQVVFLAKAGRYYRIATQNLAAGVDTVLSVNAGGHILTNDDAKPTSLYSEVILVAPTTDTTVTITITNRGPYGITTTYTLVVEEILPTPVPTGSATLLSSQPTAAAPIRTTQPTSTSAPTHTAAPPTSTQIPPTNTLAPTNTPIPSVPPSPTPLPPTSTATFAPTFTSIPPTSTPIPPTETPVPPTIPPTPSFAVVSANFQVTPSSSSVCPSTFSFNGAITVMGTGTVTYFFERSDGSMGPQQSIPFAGGGTANIADAWTIQGTPGFNFSGWERIHVLAPNELASNPATFLLICQPEPAPTTSALSFPLSHSVISRYPSSPGVMFNVRNFINANPANPCESTRNVLNSDRFAKIRADSCSLPIIQSARWKFLCSSSCFRVNSARNHDAIQSSYTFSFGNARGVWFERALDSFDILGGAVNVLWLRRALFAPQTTRQLFDAWRGNAPVSAPNTAQAMPLRFVIVLEPKTGTP